jgi:hypothetical protein
MDGNPDFRDLLRALNEEGARYLIVGAYAVMHFTEPRYTKDLDIWVEPRWENAQKVWRALAKFGAPLRDMTIDDFTKPKVVFQIGVEPNRVDIVMGITGVRFDTAWHNRVRAFYDDQPVHVIGREDLLRNKRRVGRPADKLDVQAISFARRWGRKRKR